MLRVVPMSSLRIPVATYRLQFNKQFRFENARVIVPYLSRLGISDLYASPIFKARQGSLHGYDVADPSRLNPELGKEADFNELVRKLSNHGMGLILDVVPNHMAASVENPWWRDVLDKKQNSQFAAFFDVDWLNFRGLRGKLTGHRRFFDIDDLIGIRVEDPRVFEATHSLVFNLVTNHKVSGLRIDHIDGLYDPMEYLLRLQQHVTPHLKETRKSLGFYIITEKILNESEDLPEEWPVLGTTGYDYLNAVNRVFVDERGLKNISEIYSRFTGSQLSFSNIVYQKKKLVTEKLFPGEIRVLGHHLTNLARQRQGGSSRSGKELTKALIEVTACLPVYRTYIRDYPLSAHDQFYLERALKEAEQRNPNLPIAALDFLKQVLLLDFPIDLTAKQKKAWLQFVMRWQQLTGAVMAKGFEDTALYDYNCLISLNEVGGNPDYTSSTVDGLHQFNLARLKHWPCSLNASSTHDTKRSEDVRARINVLSEIPGEWDKHLTQWSLLNRKKKLSVNRLPVPEPNMEILLYQTLVGAWPLKDEGISEFRKRLKAYMIKASREAKVFTNWLQPNKEYEEALLRFVDYVLEHRKENEFLASFKDFQKKIAYYGALNSLSQVLLKITSPGVPDFYQGTELWDFSLVDPDNRRPVDFKTRVKVLDELTQQEVQGQEPLTRQVLNSWQDGRVKLYVIYKALNVRKSCSDLFQDGEYIPLQVVGHRQEHVCAFARRKGGRCALVVIPRLLTKLVRVGVIPAGQKIWGEDLLLLPDGVPEYWLDSFTGDKIKASGTANGLKLCDILRIFPVALLNGIYKG